MSKPHYPGEKLSRAPDATERDAPRPGDSTGAQRPDTPLTQSERAALDAIFEHTSDYVLVCDRHAKPIAFNRAYANIVKEALGIDMRPGLQPHTLLPDPETVAWWEEQHRRVLSGESFGVEYAREFPGLGARTFEFNFSPTLADGAVVGFTEISRDITAHKQLEESLRASETLHRSLLESVADVVFALDTSGRYLHFNERMAANFKLRAQDVVGKKVEEFFPPDVARAFVANLRAVVASGERLVIPEERVVNAFGEFLVTTTMSPVKDANGQVFAVVGVSTDITEAKRAEEERRRLEAQIQRAQKFESLSLLASGVAHDFNNILVAVLGNATLLLRQLSRDDPCRRNVQAIEAAAEQASDLARQMLTYAGKGRSVPSHVDLNEMVRETTAVLEATLPENVALEYDLGDPIPALEADAVQLRQILLNLVINAAEAIGDEPGRVEVRTGEVDCARDCSGDRFVVGARPEGVCAVLEVTDTGCGMEEETASQIFDPFFSTKLEGRGLGLAAVAGIIRGHRGAASIDSAPGMGTKLRVLLPAKATKRRDARATASPAGSEPLRGRCVLIVDDEATVRNVGRQIAELFGMRVLLAEDGEQAIARFESQGDAIDVVLLDLTMPRLSGHETLQRLRRHRRDVPVVLCSGLETRADVAEEVGPGSQVFLRKPYDLDDFEAAFLTVFGQRAND